MAPSSPAVTTIWVTITVDPSDSQTFLEALRPLWDGAKTEEALLFFDVAESQDHPGTFHLVEIWAKDKEWLLNVQLQKPYYEPYHEITKRLWKGERRIEFSTRIPSWNVMKPERLQKNA